LGSIFGLRKMRLRSGLRNIVKMAVRKGFGNVDGNRSSQPVEIIRLTFG
jgi:hypothetical protein